MESGNFTQSPQKPQQESRAAGFRAFAEKKGFELTYALFRLSTAIPHREYRERLQKVALSLLESSSLEDWDALRSELSLVNKYMHIGEEIGLVGGSNAAIMTSEVSKLQSAIAESTKESKLPDLDIADLFSGGEAPFFYQQKEGVQEANVVLDEPVHEETVISGEDEDDAGKGGVKAAMRQSAILDKIRQTENCRIKDLQEVLPDVSERTLRYDLQELMGQGLIERVGTGGPGVSYRMRVFEI